MTVPFVGTADLAVDPAPGDFNADGLVDAPSREREAFGFIPDAATGHSILVF